MEIREYNDLKNFINENLEVALSWAAYYTNKKECLINHKLYYVERFSNLFVKFDDGSHMEGNIVKFTNLKTKKSMYAESDYLKEVRENNKIASHLICFSKESLTKNQDEELLQLLTYKMPRCS